jgi:hypothetical protein
MLFVTHHCNTQGAEPSVCKLNHLVVDLVLNLIHIVSLPQNTLRRALAETHASTSFIMPA